MRLRLLPATSVRWTLWQRLRGQVGWRTHYWNEDGLEPRSNERALKRIAE